MKPDSIDHIAIIVSDLKRTVDFYSKFLGVPVRQDEEKAVFTVGSTTLYFKLPSRSFGKIDKDSGGVNHIAFSIATINDLEKIHTQLNEASVKNSGITTSKMGKKFIWLDDPDEYRLEFYVSANLIS